MKQPVATFSIVAADVERGDIGIAVASKFLAVGAVVPWAKADVGAVATQSYANTSYGPNGLQLLSQGFTAEDVMRRLVEADDDREQRQAGIVGGDGTSATYTGEACHAWAGGTSGPGYAIQGNILSGPKVVDSMQSAFLASSGLLADRLLAALEAGDGAGGDRRGRQSAAVLVVRTGGGYAGFNDRYVDLRVDDHTSPIEEIKRIRGMHRLYFEPPTPDDVIPISPEIARDLARILAKTGDLEPVQSQEFDSSMEAALRTLYSRENLEERWQGEGRIDRVALEYLRRTFLPED